MRALYYQRLISKPDQGKVMEVSGQWSVSNHFVRSGQFTRFCDWRFVHRARLDCLSLNGASRWDSGGDKRCRRCGYAKETLPHVINHCNPQLATITRRHDAVLDRIVKAIPGSLGEVQVDRKATATTSMLIPDISRLPPLL